VDFGDIDHDGLFDILVTNFTEEPDALYWNRANRASPTSVMPRT